MNACDNVAVEQLYDELLARHWALHAVAVELCPLAGNSSTECALQRAATRILHELSLRELEALDVLRFLYPVAVPDTRHEWWATPLGRALESASRARHPGRSDHRNVTVSDIASSASRRSA